MFLNGKICKNILTFLQGYPLKLFPGIFLSIFLYNKSFFSFIKNMRVTILDLLKHIEKCKKKGFCRMGGHCVLRYE